MELQIPLSDRARGGGFHLAGRRGCAGTSPAASGAIVVESVRKFALPENPG